MNEKIHKSWQKKLALEFEKPYFQEIMYFLEEEKKLKKNIFPEEKNIFNAFNQTSFDDIKVVLLGQDPYHGPMQAHGLSFSVQKGLKVPPSLRNMYKEIFQDLGYPAPNHGELTSWAKQGVLLLNAILTVEQKKPASHSKIGWGTFTDRVIEIVSNERKNVVFLLWGAFAQKKEALINPNNGHLILKTTHPSPFSAHKGFLGCGHFSKTNEFLVQNNQTPINWEIVD